jgi:rfaE bifunctional protein kinase chain/domain
MIKKVYRFQELLSLEPVKCLAYGHFDLIHPGHIRYLSNARKRFSYLSVAISADKPVGSPTPYTHAQSERGLAVAELYCVDNIILLDRNGLRAVVEKLRPAVLILGEEYKSTNNCDVLSAIDLQVKSGRTVIYDSGGDEVSVSLLSRSEPDIVNERYSGFFKALDRNNIHLDKLASLLEEWKDAKILVIGDSIVDRYVDCEALGLSAEAPVIVVREKLEESFAGGAAVVASHIAELGGDCSLISVVGEDPCKQIINEALERYGVSNFLVTDSSRPTTLKTRFIVQNQKLFRTSRLESGQIDRDTEDAIIHKIKRIAHEVDVIVVSDFNYGVITETILEALISLAEEHKFHLIGDLQCSSQFGSILKFKGFSLITPNEREARIALHDKDSGIEFIAQTLIGESSVDSLILKLGSEGFIFYQRGLGGPFSRAAFPALSVAPIDVTGAGDSILAVFALALARKQSLTDASALAVCIAAEVVETLGNAPVSAERLLTRLREVSLRKKSWSISGEGG